MKHSYADFYRRLAEDPSIEQIDLSSMLASYVERVNISGRNTAVTLDVLLKEHPKSVKELTAILSLPPATVDKHLVTLANFWDASCAHTNNRDFILPDSSAEGFLKFINSLPR